MGHGWESIQAAPVDVLCGCLACVQVLRDSLTWPPGTSGVLSFWLSLQAAPASGRLLLRLVQPAGALLDPAAVLTEVVVQSPVVGFGTDLVGAAAVHPTHMGFVECCSS